MMVDEKVKTDLPPPRLYLGLAMCMENEWEGKRYENHRHEWIDDGDNDIEKCGTELFKHDTGFEID